jgi:hypothetical protein
MYPLSKLETLPPLTSVMSQDLPLRKGAPRLQTDLWTFSINITSPLRVYLALLNATELDHYRVTCIVVLPGIKCSSTSSSSLSLAFVMYTFSGLL